MKKHHWMQLITKKFQFVFFFSLKFYLSFFFQTFDRIVADTQLWRKKLDSYKETIEQREATIENLKKEISDLHIQKQTSSIKISII